MNKETATGVELAAGNESTNNRSQTIASFATCDELAVAVAGWPMARLVELWNAIPGVVPVNLDPPC